MKYAPTLHHRRSIRLRGYDYSQEGAYFITICAHHRRCIFGHIENQEMVLNEYDQVADEEWEKLPERWPQVALGAFQIMPNHIHGIVIINDVVGVPLAGTLVADHGVDHVADDPATTLPETAAPETGVPETAAPETGVPETAAPETTLPETAAPETGVPARGTPTATNAPTEMRITQIQWATKPTAGQIVGAYQSCVSTGCLKIAKSKQPEEMLDKLWQRNFWEYIIRDVRAFDMISNYIITNPAQWEADKLYTGA